MKNLGFLSLLLILNLLACQNTENTSKRSMNNNKIPFQKEGLVQFISSSQEDTIRQIAVEVADNDAERSQGLMHRNDADLPPDSGMLFIFDQPDFQQFWMHNTLISLDIIFVDAQNKIVHIAKYTQPNSDEPIPSQGIVQYIVEVKAGFCDTHKIEAGDQIRFTLDKNTSS